MKLLRSCGTLLLALLGALPGAAAAQRTPLPLFCTGDCDGNREVSVDELVMGVEMALARRRVTACDAFDDNLDFLVRIDELTMAVLNATYGCAARPPSRTPTRTPSATPSRTPTATITWTRPPTRTPTNSETPTHTATATPSASLTATQTSVPSPTRSPTLTPTATPPPPVLSNPRGALTTDGELVRACSAQGLQNAYTVRVDFTGNVSGATLRTFQVRLNSGISGTVAVAVGSANAPVIGNAIEFRGCITPFGDERLQIDLRVDTPRGTSSNTVRTTFSIVAHRTRSG